MIDAGSKFSVSYRNGTKQIEVFCLAGRKFGKLVTALNKCGSVTDQDSAEMFDVWIPEALALVFGDEKFANDMWDNKLTMQDAMEIITACVEKHSVSGEDRKKSE